MKLSRETKIGLVFVIALTLLIWGLNFLKGKTLFKTERNFFAVYEHIDGLIVANPVNINGFAVGQVTDISFESETSPRIIVEFMLDKKIQIPENSVARIYSEDLLGGKSIDLVLGDSKAYCKPGDTLTSSIEKSLREEVNRQVEPIRRKAENLISSIDSIVTVIQYVFNENMQDDLLKSASNLKTTFANLSNTTTTLDQLVLTQQQRLIEIIGHIESITSNLQNSNEEITNILSNFSAISDTVTGLKISKTFGDLNQSLADISVIVDKISRGEGSLGLLINDEKLYQNLVTSSSELNLLLEDLRLNPSRYVSVSVFGKNPEKHAYSPSGKEGSQKEK
ncbi:MAG: MlaD family protein [Bacteroidales bacterium]|nr:MCE family protein [Lentimicrobiaceae bacterium]MDD5693921.1 MlaD family protein [Bacteroidales bacterium]